VRIVAAVHLRVRAVIRRAAIGLVLVAAAAPARADEPVPAPGPAAPPALDDRSAARELARRAVDVATAGGQDPAALATAIDLTRQAHAIDPDPLYLCNIGGFFRVLEDWPRAHSYLGRCLQLLPASRPDEVTRFRAVLDEVDRAVAVDHVAVLIDVQPPIAMIEVSTFTPAEATSAPALVWLPVGIHTIRAIVPGRGQRERTVEITPAMLGRRDRQLVAIDLARAEGPPRSPAIDARAVAPRRARRLERVLGYGAIGAGAAAAVSFGLALGYRRAADGEPAGSPAFEDNRARFRAFNVAAPILAGVALVAGAGWYYERSRRRRGPVLGLVPHADGALVTLEVSR
jgi:hypothetical protein